MLVATFFFLKHPARGAFLTKKLLPRLQIQCSLLCNRTVLSNARYRAEATLTEATTKMKLCRSSVAMPSESENHIGVELCSMLCSNAFSEHGTEVVS